MKNKGRSSHADFISNMILGVLMGVSMCIVGASIILLIISSEPWHLLIIFPAIILEYFVFTAAHELGHLIFGLLSGYSFCSYRIGNLMWVKLPEGIKLRRMSIAGTGGQCLMTPPEPKDGKIPVFLYNFGGVLVNLIIAVLLFVLYVPTRSMPILPYVFIIGAEFSLIMAIFNGVPIKIGGIANDGLNAFALTKDKNANAAIRQQLLIISEQTKGARIADMPEEWFSLPDDADMNHHAVAAVIYCNRLMELEMFDEAEKSILQLINADINLVAIHRSMLVSDLIYCLLLRGETERAARYYTKEQKSYMNALKSTPSILRTEYALAICKIEGAKNAEEVRRSFEKIAKKYPYQTDIALDNKLISLIEAKCKNQTIN